MSWSAERVAAASTSNASMLPPTPGPLLRFRDEFPILATTNYMVSNSLGAMPRAVSERLADYARVWGASGAPAWAQGWGDLPLRVGGQIPPLLGVKQGGTAMVPNVPIAPGLVLSPLEVCPVD